jgi:hypothetical protein
MKKSVINLTQSSESKGGKVRQTTITNPTKLLSDAQRLAGRENHNRRSC